MDRCYFGEGKMIQMPKARFVEEHTNLIKILREGDSKKLEKEAKEQSKELKKEIGGSQASGFIARMLGEVKAKHDGVYKNPTKPLRKDSKMNKPVAFDYFKMPKDSREKSKFIMDKFFKVKPYKKGEREELNEAELKMLREAEAERQRKSRANRKAKKEAEEEKPRRRKLRIVEDE
jgi:hypothetical protein